jgi:hypothetical protein
MHMHTQILTTGVDGELCSKPLNPGMLHLNPLPPQEIMAVTISTTIDALTNLYIRYS